MIEGGTNGKAPSRLAKWSLAMIVEPAEHRAAELERCLKSIAAYPDEVVITITAKDGSSPGAKAVESVAKQFGAKISYFEWIEDFAAARNFSFAQCSNDVVMWLDSDDTVESPQKLAQCVREAFGRAEIDSIHAEYLYDFDESGQCTTVLARERIVDRRAFEWRAPIHELLCDRFQTRATRLPPQLGRVIHNHKRNDAAQRASLERNLRVIERHYLPVEQGGLGENCDERMLFYWANTLLGLGRPEEALGKFMEYVPRSGAPAEIQQALVNASECARMIGKLPEARALAQQAIDRNPEAPTGYFMLAQAHNVGNNAMLAEHYALLCLERANKFQQEIVSNPKAIFGGSALIAAQAKYKQHKLAEIEPLLQVAEKYMGSNDPLIVEMRANIADWSHKNKLLNAYNVLREEVEKRDGVESVRKLAKLAPEEIMAHPSVAAYLPKNRPSGKKSIAFYCGGGMPGVWGPELLSTGIGGSEEAVCYLSEQFAKAGWHVEVYAPCNRQTWQGVEWYPVEQYSGDSDDSVLDVLVVWRAAYQIVTNGSSARRTYLWLHDTPNRAAWVNGVWDAYDGIFVLSKFHDGVYDFVPQDKKILSANGLPTEKLVPIDQLENEPHRFVYASCPTRGLETVLLWWEQIRKEIPDAELDVYYGFHPTLMKQCEAKDPYSRAIAQCVRRIDELRKQPGVNWHGFVGHDVLHEGFSKCGLWLYPTQFPEISCITAMKMQAHGVVPVCSTIGALPETVTHGVKIPNIDTLEGQKLWCDSVIALAKNPPSKEERVEMAKAARARFSWKAVCDQWDGIFSDHLKQPGRRDRFYARNRMDLMRA